MWTLMNGCGEQGTTNAPGGLACCPAYGVYERIARMDVDEETLADFQKAVGACPAVRPEPDSDPAVRAAGGSGGVGR